MKREDYYKLLKEKYERTDWNKYARELRKMIDEEGGKEDE